MKKYYIYLHRRSDNGEVFYIGKGSGRRAWSSQGRSEYWHRVKNKYGVDIEVLDYFESEEEAFRHEIALIALHRNSGLRITNITNGGEGATGAKRSEETRKKLSDAALGRKRSPDSEQTRHLKSESAKGRKMSPEAVAKIKEFHTGRKRKPETLLRMSEALKGKGLGRIKSSSERAKLSAGRKGKLHSEETKLAMKKNRTGKKKRPQTEEHREKIAEARRAFWRKWRESRNMT